MANLIISICLIMCLTVYASCNKVGLQKRLAMVEDRKDDLSTTHRGDFYDANLRLDTLEAHLNASLKEFVNQQPAVETDKILSDTTLSHEVRIISQALSDEKSRWRREASAIKVSIKGTTTGQTTTLTTTKAHDQTTTLATTTAHDQTTNQTTTSPVKLPSCLELHRNGERQSGVYTIYPFPSHNPVQVYCDMDTDGGGWTVFQRRQDGSVNFHRTWADYASGFGNVSGEFWLGNDLISSLTSRGTHELRIDMTDFVNHSAFANYGRFKVSPSEANYALEVGVFSGYVADPLYRSSGLAFSTWDRDNDGNCAQDWRGGWWYNNNCGYSNLNGPYGRRHGRRGVWWSTWKYVWTEMKLRATPQA